jgi:WD40 repeat protein
MDFSPDSKTLAIGDDNHRLQGVDLASGNTAINIPEAHPEGISAVAWSSNGAMIASGSGYSGGPIRLWDAASGELLGELEGHTSWICDLVFSKDGLSLYSASGDQTIRIWDVEQRQPLATLRGSGHEVYGLGLSPDGKTLASACKDGVVAFWSALPRPEKQQPRRIESGKFSWPAFAPDSPVLAAPRAGTVSLFDLTTFEEIEQIDALGTDDVWMVAYSPDGTRLVSGSRSGKIRVWSCAGRRLLAELGGHRGPIVGLYFRADGRRLLSVDQGGKAIWWDASTWQPVKSFTLKLTGGVAVSPNGRLLVMGAPGVLRWFNAETGDLLQTSEGPLDTVVQIAFSGDSSLVAGVSQYGTVAMWDPSSFQSIPGFQGHMQAAFGVAFSPDSRTLATGGGTDRDAVKLWHVSTLRELMTCPGEGSRFRIVIFSPDGRWLATRSMEGMLHLWYAPSWAEIEAIEKGLPGGP